jgi:hypothetical protein
LLRDVKILTLDEVVVLDPELAPKPIEIWLFNKTVLL